MFALPPSLERRASSFQQATSRLGVPGVTELFLSEYIEGSSNNKALEIFNGTGAAVDLAAGNYDVQMYFNGNSNPGLTIRLTGTVADGDVYVLAHSNADPAILAQADQTNGAGWFNGNDVVVLRKNGVVLDVIGQIGFDPGTEWGSGLTSTADNTLRRKDTILGGDPNGGDAFDPSVEWIGLATETFDGLGNHNVLVPSTPTPEPTSTLEPTPTDTPTSTPTLTPSPTSTPSPTATPEPVLPLLISEVLYDGETPQTEGDEFVEIYNPHAVTIDLSLYRLGDEETASGSEGFYRFPVGASIDPGATVLIAKNAEAFQARFGMWPHFELRPDLDTPEVPDLARDTSWGSGHWALSNTGDEVVLVGPADEILDAIVYGNGNRAAVGVAGDVRAAAPLSLQRLGTQDTNEMNADFLAALPVPGRVTELPAAPPPVPGLALSGGMWAYWGDLQAQSSFSDGAGPPTYAYAVARANGLHFLGIADHSHHLTPERWASLRQIADQASQAGAFIGLAGFEWTHPSDGHLNVFGIEALASRDDPATDTLGEFYAWLVSQPGAIAQFNHPDPLIGDFQDFAYEPGAAGAIALIELSRGQGHGYRRLEESYLRALWAGWRVGAANNSDTHEADWGSGTWRRTGILARELSEAELLTALRARRIFATEDYNLAIALRANGTWMGSRLPATSELDLVVEMVDRDGELATLELWDRNRLIASQAAAGATQWSIQVAPRAGHFYWARSIQADGDRAYTSPLWIEGSAAAETIMLNEILPAPRSDWNGDGRSDTDDEWVELYNPGPEAVGLGGWILDDRPDGGSPPYTIPLGMEIPPRGFILLYRSQTRLALNDDGDTVRLLRPEGSLADEFSYPGSRDDQSFSRTLEGGWSADYEVTPGAPNRPRPSQSQPSRGDEVSPTTVAGAKVLAANSRVIIEGQVTAPPELLGRGVLYLQDSSAGIRIYMRQGAYLALKEGDHVRVRGRVGSFHGEAEIRVSQTSDVELLGPGDPLAPLAISTREGGEEREGSLVAMRGRVMEIRGASFYLDDGSGAARVFVRDSTGIPRPPLEIGDRAEVIGIVSQYAQSAPFEGGYRLLPRYASDIVREASRRSSAPTPRPTIATPVDSGDRSVFFVGGATPEAVFQAAGDEVAIAPPPSEGMRLEWFLVIPLGLGLALAISRWRASR